MANVGEEFCKFVIQFFKTGKLPQSINTTWVILIPKKKDGDIRVNDFRTISMVGSIYKIAKILSKRLQKVLPRLVSDSQTAFVKR